MNPTNPHEDEFCRSWKFTPTGWTPDQWILVRNPGIKQFGKWVQKDDCIENAVPHGISPEDLQSTCARDAYVSMVYARRFTADLRIAVTMAFAYRMAPLIVVAPEMGADPSGQPEYREHFDIVMYDQGVNLWHHTYTAEKSLWVKAAYAKFPLKSNTRYALEVELKGQILNVKIDGHEFGYTASTLPATCYVGITACEGVNRFYDMTVAQIPSL